MLASQQIPSIFSTIQYSMAHAVTVIAKEIGANIVVTLTRQEGVVVDEESLTIDMRAVVFRQTLEGQFLQQIHEAKLVKDMDSLQPIKDLLRDFVNKKVLSRGDRVICVGDDTLGVGFSGLMFILDVDDVFFKVSTHKLTEFMEPGCFDSLIGIALEIAREGREGKRVGTAFVIAHPDEIKPFIKQLILNPFLGYATEQKRVIDPGLKETLKEFAQLDGIFIISREGIVVSAGSYLNVDTAKVEIGAGFGTKHRCCSAITKEIDAIAIVVSESGVVRVMKNGKIIARLM